MFVELLDDPVERVFLLFLRTGVHHHGRVRVDRRLARVQNDRLVEARLAKSVCRKVHLVEEVSQSFALGDDKTGDEVPEIPHQLLPVHHRVGHDRRHARVHADELLALHLEVGLAVLRPVDFLVEPPRGRVDVRRKLGGLHAPEEPLRERLHLVLHREHAHPQQRRLELRQDVDVGRSRQGGGRVERVERVLDVLHLVVEVQHEQVFARLAEVGLRAVEAREALHRQHARERLVHVHRREFRLVESRDVLVRHHEDAVLVLLELLRRLRVGEAVDARLGIGVPAQVLLARERDERPVGEPPLADDLADGEMVLDGAFDVLRHHQRLGVSAETVVAEQVRVEMAHHHVGLLGDRLGLALHEPAQLLLRLLAVVRGIVPRAFDDLVVAPERRVVRQHVKDEPLLDRLFHRVEVERMETAVLALHPEPLQRLPLRRGGEREVGRVRAHLSLLDELPDQLVRVGLLLAPRPLHGRVHLAGRDAALRRMRLVDDDAEVLARHVADRAADERKLLDRGDDDALAVLDGRLEELRAVGVGDDVRRMAERLDVVRDLPVEDASVGHNEHGVEERRAESLRPVRLHGPRTHPDQLVREPRERIALPRPRGMLDEVALPDAVLRHVAQKLVHHVQLVVAREDELLHVLHHVRNLLAALRLAVVEERVVLDDVRDRRLRQHALPEVGRLESVRVVGIPRALSVGQPLVEWHERRLLPRKSRGEEHLVLVEREVRKAPPEVQERVARIAVLAVLLLPVVARRLARPRVLQLEGEERQAVHENHHVELVAGMAQRERLLARDGELVLREVLPRRRAVARSRTRIPEVELDVVHIHALAQNLQDAELLDLRGDLLRHVLVERSLSPVRLQPVGLRRLQERPQPPRVHGKSLVHVRRLAPEEAIRLGRLRRHVGTRAALLARGPDKRLLDLPLKRLLIRHARAHATFTFPVTTSSMTI